MLSVYEFNSSKLRQEYIFQTYEEEYQYEICLLT